MFVFTAIPPVIMNALEKRAFMRVSRLSFLFFFLKLVDLLDVQVFYEAEKSPAPFPITCTKNTFYLFFIFCLISLQFCLL